MIIQKVMVFIFLILIVVHVLAALKHPLTIAMAFPADASLKSMQNVFAFPCLCRIPQF
ncbi:hypothetical protein QN416_02840 [Glaciimonas sp. Cout2]|uniref:hypothetical protein n=1 Tax=unclassified Glaciimonas TaxID=2644401 RepID=UPI002AB5DD9A|nr:MULTISPECIES: hypothetical protein [unclassified Glaciimonas]MDY7548300.1 hypothetical protein [Glaciimonas sp. CA11.2]MEB0010550.1 hypothetical protein [Glaciimonas sp. Cout2]